MSTTIKIKCIDQTLTYEGTPTVASGGVNEDYVQFEFCPLWDGFLKVAVFYQNKGEIYYSIVSTTNVAVIPKEVIATKGTMYLGVLGVKDNVTKTSLVLPYRIENGALDGFTPEEPTQELYQQVLNLSGEMVQKVNELQQAQTAQYNQLSSRMDTLTSLAEGSTTGDAELQDIRVGIDGTVYSSAGTAVRSQINSLKEDLGDVSDEIVRDNLIKPSSIESGYFSLSDSILKEEINESYRRIKNIKIPSKNSGKIYIRTSGYSKIFFQNLDKKVVSSSVLESDHTVIQNIEIPQNAIYLSMFWKPSSALPVGSAFISTTKSELKKYYYENFSMPNYDFSENLDNTLSIAGRAADAKAVGDAIKGIFDGKIMLFAGDSICYGANWRPTPDDYSTTGWRKLVQEKYPTAKTYGYGVGGTTIAIRANRTDSIYERLTKMYSEHSDADYVILQGGVNDCWGKVPLGEITKNYNKELDTSTFCGAMEQLLKDAILKWKGKKIGFICTYKVHDADTIIDSGDIMWDFKSYMDKAKEICDKWSVPYCDLYNESGLCLKLDDIANAYSDGGTHVNELGYRIIFPKIDSWLKTL